MIIIVLVAILVLDQVLESKKKEEKQIKEMKSEDENFVAIKSR